MSFSISLNAKPQSQDYTQTQNQVETAGNIALFVPAASSSASTTSSSSSSSFTAVA